MPDHSDVIIIGAGAAGLAAARDISGAGKSVAVLEARQRIGGRIFTLHDAGVPLPIELGAEFIHGDAETTFSIVEAAALTAYQLPDDHWTAHEGNFQRIRDFWGTMYRLLRRIPEGRDMSFAEFLDRQKKLAPRVKQMAIQFAEGYNAAHANRISAASLRASDEEQEEPKQYRIANGYDALIEWLRAGIDPTRGTLHLNAEATEVTWKRRDVEVKTRSGQTFHANAAVISIPIGVWKSRDSLRFDPPLRDKERALEKLEVGHVVKVVARFRERFWDPERNFIHSSDPFFPTWWTTSPVRAPILTGWSGGHAADRVLGSGDITRRALESLALILGCKRREIESKLDSVHMHNWQADPFSRGAYSYAAVGGAHAHDTLARQLGGTLFFAGEATTSSETGTVAGAIATGRRAAKQVLKNLA